ncbi:uncharacterized protein EURHEDRAFT_464220 [Aspergillus ruber CBS 135680]|uniref:Uncharacterized protein n=1 Tax=Aspergillus ruber (strain CBS 135680) TaxID=1388766 RepID=A0A017S6N5_ASPRC|nr:uncharacterized protein EURHEDRAFT_464220 [Aspergillus ruber CBS 135680]EYE91835.1 hypothetical protein EURHEDRAFT_464220 [Aspergillus ruber CBS 135680]
MSSSSILSSKPSTASSKSTNSSHPALFNLIYPRFYRAACNTQSSDKPPEPSRLADIDHESTTNEARIKVIQALTVCRTVISSLEVTRLRKSRVGFDNWLSFWERVYRLELARKVVSPVVHAYRLIDELFRTVAQELKCATQRCVNYVMQAQSATDISQSVQLYDPVIRLYCRRRRKRARDILDEMRESIKDIPMHVSDDFFTDVKRGVFALNERCEYHPGDPIAEERERVFRLEVSPEGLCNQALSPQFYRDHQERIMRVFHIHYDRLHRQELVEQLEQYHACTDVDEGLIHCPTATGQGNDAGPSHGHPGV